MKKLVLLTALMALISLYCRSQVAVANKAPVYITAGIDAPGIEGSPRVTLGTIESSLTSREKVLAYPRLLAQELNCEVTGFKISITANNKTWGPFEVKGAVFTEEVKDKIKELEAPPSVKIAIDNIHVKCNGADVVAQPISVEYDH